MYKIEINPDGEIWHNDTDQEATVEMPSDKIQESVKRYCEGWETLKAKEKGLPLAAVLRSCADEVEKRLTQVF